MNTHNILFIAVGACNVLKNIIKKRLNNRLSDIGYISRIQPSNYYGFDYLRNTTPAFFFRAFGLIPEACLLEDFLS